LVKAWKKSGETAAVFAASRGVASQTLTWWKWRLSHRADLPHVDEADECDEMRLVAVQVEPARARAEATAAWELLTARGDVLRVYAGTVSSELVAVVQALVSGEERR
jgi:hypothetical protein